jgi:serine/threonine protein kinase
VGPPIDVFISYAAEDVDLCKELDAHLATMRRENLICAWDQRQVAAGDAFQATIERHLAAARVIVLLASAAYITSDYLHDVEMTRALDRARVGDARVIPVIIRAFDCGTLFDGLQILPRNGQAVTSYSNRDEVWKDVVLEIREAIGRAPAIQADPPPRNDQSAYEPVYEDASSRALAEELERARCRRAALKAAGSTTAEVDREILELRRQLREGGRLRPGDALDNERYLLLEHIGQGGFASVWKALDRKDDKMVAIKVMHPDQAREASRRERFFRGARVMAKLEHQAVVSVLEDRGEDGKYLYFVMELVDGLDLHRAVREGRVAMEDVVPLILRVGEALAEAHAKGFVHRDVKPANILLDALRRPRLTDFDLVAAWDTTGATRTGGMGTFLFAAPEQLHNAKDADARTDVYSLGMTAIFCFHSGDLPMSVIRRPEGVIEALQCSRAIRRVLARAIEVEPDARHEDAQTFCDALRRAAVPWMSDEHFWRRRGSEAQGEDWGAENYGPLTKTEIVDILAYHLDDDLPDNEEHREAALDWAAEGYVDDLRRMLAEKLHNDARKEGRIDTMICYIETQLGRDLSESERRTVALRYDTLDEGRELFALSSAELGSWLGGSGT